MRRVGSVLLVLCCLSVLAAAPGVVCAEEPAPVDRTTQCLAFVELVVKDRANAQTEASYFAARTKALTEENETLKQKVRALETLKPGPKAQKEDQ